MDRSAPVIAILDDEEKLRLALARLLKAHGCKVASFATGEELLAAIEQKHFDCVLLDLFMPGMSGFDVLAALRSRISAPPVIVITAHDEPELVNRALALNALECQRKPIGAPALLDAIDRALHRH
jgi:CheY-like chemotaxis protein